MSWASLVIAAGILLSRIAGFIRVRVFSHYFGLQSDAADAFNAAFRIPNFLQNLFGEGVLSASFIPVYAGLRARGDEEGARRVATAVGSLLGLIVSLLVLAGVLLTPWLITVIAPGFSGEKREMTIRFVRILFPGAGCLALSAWCLGVLNSHGRFFLSYVAPVAWNLVMIATLVVFGARLALYPLAEALAIGSVLGSLAQVVVQLPVVLGLLGGFRPSLDLAARSAAVRTVLVNFVPVFFSRGVVQISAYIDALFASLLPTGAVTGLFNAQLLYTLPVSLFGMSVSAAELPVMSGARGTSEQVAEHMRRRLEAGLPQIAFFVVPSSVAFLALGDLVAAALFQTGRFTGADSIYVWGILAGSAVGLLAATFGRLYSSAFYALGDTRTPLRYAIVHVIVATGAGYVCAFPMPRALGFDQRWGAAGLTFAAGLGAWIELLLLRRNLNGRIGRTGMTLGALARLWIPAAVAAAAGWAARVTAARATLAAPWLLAILVFAPFGLTYFGLTMAFGVAEARGLYHRVHRWFIGGS
jgi:putative peptidoglycan lipid II flippase